MKKLISLLICGILLFASAISLSSCSKEKQPAAKSDIKTLYVYNWGEYMSDGSDDSLDVNKAFEDWYYEEYGEHVNVNYSTYSSNEDLYAKITSGAVVYDVIVPSDYMVQRLKDEGYLAPLNYENIPNMEHILPEFKGDNAYYDKNNVYSVPYLYGMVGIIYSTMVDPNDPDILSGSKCVS